MSSIAQNGDRIACFTSSEIVALAKDGKVKGTWGAAGNTYIEEKKMEMRLGIGLDSEVEARAMTWGNIGEMVVELLLREWYDFTPTESRKHPTVPFWSGARDGLKKGERTIAEVKCPYTRKSLCGLVNPLYDGLEGIDAMNAIRNGYKDKTGFQHAAHKDGDKYYWQIVSNACISDCTHGELIVYMPYESELSALQSAAEKLLTEGKSEYYYIASAKPGELPYIKDGGTYSNINIIRFEIPQSDKDLLTQRVLQAGEYLK